MSAKYHIYVKRVELFEIYKLNFIYIKIPRILVTKGSVAKTTDRELQLHLDGALFVLIL